MDGAWTGHPDQNEIAVSQFPHPNQIQARPVNTNRIPIFARCRQESASARSLERAPRSAP